MKRNASQSGVAMIEVLIALLVAAFGVLGFVGLQARTSVSQLEGYQRAQALMLATDAAERISLNRKNAAAYVGNNIALTDPGNCNNPLVPFSLANKDLCEWSQALRGAGETKSGNKLGAMIGARGCISSLAANEYLISIAWQGLQPSGAPANTCGRNAYSAENMRRVVTTVVRFATLVNP